MLATGSRDTAMRLLRDHMWDPETAWSNGKPRDLHLEGDCEDPAYIDYVGYPCALSQRQEKPVYVGFWVRCRRCGSCRQRRSRGWSARALRETLRAVRTWHITVTLSPDSHYQMLCRTAGKDPEHWSDLNLRPRRTIDTFQARHREIGKELTLWLKRLRKSGGPNRETVRFRYIIVAEPHTGKRWAGRAPPARSVVGYPHYHILIHELPGHPLRMELRQEALGRFWKGCFDEEWDWGFVKTSLIDNPENGARYVTKYIAKEATVRIRASQRYGVMPDPVTDAVSLDVVPSFSPTAERIQADRWADPHDQLWNVSYDPPLRGVAAGQQGGQSLYDGDYG